MMSVEEYYSEIPLRARVVFDWDNTLKIVNKETKCIECRVKPSFLRDLVTEKGCQLYIISAIRPSRMNMDTLLMEVDRLGIRDFFCPYWQSQHHPITRSESDESYISPSANSTLGLQKSYVEMIRGNLDTYVRWGNIIICGYDKAEVFLDVVSAEKPQDTNLARTEKTREDVVDAMPEYDGEIPSLNEIASEKPEMNTNRLVIFFDDEEVNILNFSKIVKNSVCIWVK